MTHIDFAGGGGRTVTNGTVHDARKVYEIVASVVLDEYAPHPGGEMERTGVTVTEDRTYHVIARSEPLAMALYDNRWGNKFHRHTFKSIKLLFVIDEEITTGHG